MPKLKLRTVLVIVLALLMTLSLSSCDIVKEFIQKECEHTDANSDGKCDKCDEVTEKICESHTDAECDGICDICEAEIEISHSDANGDGTCDKCTAPTDEACLSHTDGDCDGKCDKCSAEVDISHSDANGDGTCDKCGGCLSHTDANCSGKCDICDATTPIHHADESGDGKCDKCATCIEHRDENCDNICDNCPSAVMIGHKDTDGDGVCDKCDACTVHIDGECNGKCDKCDEDITVIHKDENNDNKCDKCGADVVPVRVSARKTASVAEGKALYPAHYIAWNDTTYRGAYVTYTITVTNLGESTATVELSDVLSEYTELVSGCDRVVDGTLSWMLTVPLGGEASISYTVAVKTELTSGAYVDGGKATVNGESISCYNLYIAPTLNEIDQEYIEKAIGILSKSTYSGLDFAKHAYTVAFTNAKAITELLSGTPEQTLALILAGTDTKLASATVHELTSSASDSFAAGGLVSGDLVYVKSGDNVSLYIICGEQAYNITETATKLDISALIAAIGAAESYATVRPSYTMSGFTPSDPDEIPEVMNAYQEALVKTAEAYLLRGESLQYEDVWFGLISQSGEHRWAYGQKAPEEYTSDEWGYVNCAVFTYDVYLQALGYTLPKNMYTTANISANADAQGMLAFKFTNTTPGGYTEDYMADIEAQFMAALEVGDIINVRRKTATGTSGHAMLYVGNGKFIHSGGASYTTTSSGTGYEVYEPTIRCHKVKDYIFNPTSVGGNPFRGADEYGTTYVTELMLVRPLNKFTGEIPENTQNRIENMQDIRAEKLSSHPSSVTVNLGDEITFTFSVFNVGNTARTVEIYDKIPAGTVYVSGGDRIDGDELYWTVTVGAGETANVSYTVKVGDLADGTLIDGRDGTVGGVMHRCAAIRVKRTLTATEQAAIISAINALNSENSTLGGLALVNEIYKRALGIENIFADTNANNVMRDGDESVFATSSKVNNKKNLSMLRTDETYYSGMLVDHLYGGMRFDSSAKLYDRTRLLKEHNLVVGDILIGRTSSSVNIYIYAGEGNLLLINSGIGTAPDFTTVSERIMYYGRDFAVLRPSQQLGS